MTLEVKTKTEYIFERNSWSRFLEKTKIELPSLEKNFEKVSRQIYKKEEITRQQKP